LSVKVEVDPAIIQALAEYILSAGVTGRCPGWYPAFQFARALGCSVFEVEDIFRELDPEAPKEPRRVWLERAFIAMQAEAAAQETLRIRNDLAISPGAKAFGNAH